MNGWKVMGHSQIGSSHIKNQKQNQDALYYKESPYFIGAVSDGHGGSAHILSETGSRLAVSSAIESIEEWLQSKAFEASYQEASELVLRDSHFREEEKREVLKMLIANELPDKIVSRWRGKVLSHYGQLETAFHLEMTSEEMIYKLYGCTLLCAFEYEQYMVFLQIGDGLIGLYESGGSVLHPISEDKRHKNNATTSLSDLYAPLEFKTAVQALNSNLEFIALTTDGVENAYPSSDTDYIYFYHAIHGLIIEDCTSLEPLLDRTSRYSGDDSTALILYKKNCYESDEFEASEPHILSASDPEDYVPIEHYLCDPTSSRFLEIAGELCYAFDQFEASGMALVNVTFQDILYNSKENSLLFTSRILREGSRECLMRSRRILADLLYLVFYKVHPGKKPLRLILDFESAYDKVDIEPYSPGAWSLIVDQIRQKTRYDYTIGQFTFEETHKPQLSVVSQLGTYEIFYDSSLYLHQILKSKKITNHKIGSVVIHPKNPQIWGINNCSNHEWIQYIKGCDAPRYISRGKTATLTEGSVIFMYGIPIRIESRSING